MNGAKTYVLIKSGVIKEDWVGPSVIVPDVVGVHVEATWENAFLGGSAGLRGAGKKLQTHV